MSNPLTIIIVVILGLFGGYLMFRLFSSAIFKSYFEQKKKHNNKESDHGEKD